MVQYVTINRYLHEASSEVGQRWWTVVDSVFLGVPGPMR